MLKPALTLVDAPVLHLAAARVIAALPGIDEAVPPQDRPLAARVLAAPLVSGDSEDLRPALETTAPGAFGYLIIRGIVLKETTLAERSAVELLGPGDILAPPLSVCRQAWSPAVSRYRAHGAVMLAALDERFRLAVQRWPRILDVLQDHLAMQAHRASAHLAMGHLVRVEDRVVALFASLAERFGRMTPDGVVIEMPLTHELIARLVGGRRPTVSIALRNLSADGTLVRLDDCRWRFVERGILP